MTFCAGFTYMHGATVLENWSKGWPYNLKDKSGKPNLHFQHKIMPLFCLTKLFYMKLWHRSRTYLTQYIQQMLRRSYYLPFSCAQIIIFVCRWEDRSYRLTKNYQCKICSCCSANPHKKTETASTKKAGFG